MLHLARTLALVLITILATIFFVQNLATTEVAFITWSIAAPRAVVFVIVFALGWLTGYLVHALRPKPNRQKSDDPPSHATHE